jgi:3-oxoadipate enol-lactonase
VTDFAVIDTNKWPGFRRYTVQGPANLLSFRGGGTSSRNVVLFNHSILTSSAIWHRQARMLVDAGWQVICLDSRGHGDSSSNEPPYTMDDLVRDNIAVLDALGIERVHYVGVSQGGMTGFGLGIQHADRLASLCICSARADAPAPFAAAWDDRIALVRAKGIDALAAPTAERWFGKDFLAAEPVVASELLKCIRRTSADGFTGCAQAIQKLDYLSRVQEICVPITLVIGSRDEALLPPMRSIATILREATYVEIDGAGHLPQIDRAADFDAVLRRHFGF